MMLLDKDLLDPDGFSSGETKPKKNESNKSESCNDDCFNKFYDKLTERKDDKVNSCKLKLSLLNYVFKL